MIELHLGLSMAMGIYIIGSPAADLLHDNAKLANPSCQKTAISPKRAKRYVHTTVPMNLHGIGQKFQFFLREVAIVYQVSFRKYPKSAQT